MDYRLPHTINEAQFQSPTLKDQAYYSHNGLQSPWPLPQLPLPFSIDIDIDMDMDLNLGDVHSNPATPEDGGYEHSLSDSATGAHFHTKSLSGGSLDRHSPRSFSEDVTQPHSQVQQGPQGQAPGQQGQPPYHPSRHYPSPTSSSSYIVGATQFHTNAAQAQGPPLQRHHPPLSISLGTGTGVYGEHSLSQQQQQAASNGNNTGNNNTFLHHHQQRRLSGVLNGHGNVNGNHHGNGNHPGNQQQLYNLDLAFNGMDIPSSSSSTHTGNNWTLMQTNGHAHGHVNGHGHGNGHVNGHGHVNVNGYPHLQGVGVGVGVQVLPQGTYMTPQELELYTNMIEVQIQQYHDLNRTSTSSLSNSPLPNYMAGPNANTNTNTPYSTATAAPPPPTGALPPQAGGTVGGTGGPGHNRPPSQSTMSTPSLAENSPILLPWSPSFEFGCAPPHHHQHQHHQHHPHHQQQVAPPLAHAVHAAHTQMSPLRGPPTPPKLPDTMPKPPKCNTTTTAHKEKSPTTTTAAGGAGTPPPKPRHGSSGKTSISSVRSGDSQSASSSSWPVPPTPTSPPSSSQQAAQAAAASQAAQAAAQAAAAAIPLRHRVAALPRDKRALFERAAGELWDVVCPRSPKSPNSCNSNSKAWDAKEEHSEGLDRLDRAQVMLLEDLYALISSVQLRDQKEIPDDLVEPILKTILLPKAESHKGSRGGAAGHLCLWAGCGKTIKRLDHSRNHIREHCKSKPHTCGGLGSRGCGQTFLRMDDLKRHQKSHCSVLRSGPGRRPRSIRGTRRDTDEEEEGRDSEDSTSLNGGDDDDYRPIHTTRAQHHLPTVMASSSSSASTTRELASRLRSQRQRAARYVLDDSTEESDSGSHERVVVGRLQTSNVRRAIASPRVEENPCAAQAEVEGEEDGVGEDADFQK